MSIKLIDDRIDVMKQLASQFVVHNYELSNPKLGHDVNPYSDYIKRKGLLFTLDIACECYGYDEKDNLHEEWRNRERQKAYVIVVASHNVFVNISGAPDEENYINSSTHDTCWREDGFRLIRDLSWNMYKRVYSKMPDSERPNMINADFFVWDVFDSFMKSVEVKCYKKQDSHHENISEIKEIHFTDLFEMK